ncbi:MAG: acyltransferase [Chitinophagaceae bacterium]
MAAESKKDRYEELDALRGIASLMVVFFHFTMRRPEANVGFILGTTGVDLFFIISGFVIFMSLNKISCSTDFIINRVSRLYPTYWACVTFTFLILVIDSVYSTGAAATIPWWPYLANMTMFQYYLRVPDLDGPYWTMITEMLFYIGILFLFHFKWLKHLNKIGLVVCIATALSVHFGYLIPVVKAIPLLQFIPLFFAGTIFYKIYTIKASHLTDYLILAVCFICQVLLFYVAGRSKWFINQVQYIMMLTVFFSIFILFVNRKLSFIINKVTLFLGKISFALYLIHQNISVNYIIPYLTEKWHMNFWIASAFVALPVVLLLASFITFYIEAPLGRAMKARLRQKFTERPPAVPAVQSS